MATYVTCAQGHLYDADLHAACPICNGGGNVIDFSAKPVSDNIGRTAPVGGGFGASTGGAPGSGGSDNSIGETVAPDFYQKRKEEEDKTVGVFSRSMKSEPTVGWLVCIEGQNQGKDYRLLAKNNTIGRSDRMDVCIKGDMAITRENHARLDYDEKHNGYYLSPADNANTIYLNDEAMYVPSKLSAYDCIELGDSKFIFVPLCSERFTWRDGLRQGE
ncbi:MAG: FHA domain-containing protein [Lachnospiraceae bacterium]|nr:FHA domain-containing protein [Lachnospiraceae bacterium]